MVTDTFLLCDDLDPIYDLEMMILKMYPHTEDELSESMLSKVRAFSQSINARFVGRRYTTCTVSSKHDQKVHS